MNVSYFKTRCCNMAQVKQESYYSFRPLKLEEEWLFFRQEILICFI